MRKHLSAQKHMTMRTSTLANAMPTMAIASLIALAFAATGCNKEEAVEPTPAGGGSTNTGGASVNPVLAGADGALFAVKTVTIQDIPFIGPIEVEINTGVGSFYDDAGASIQAGQVRCNDSLFTYQNNAYFFQQSTSNPTGLDFSGGVEWDVTGGNGIPAFTRQITAIPFPVVEAITSAITFPRDVDYTLSTTNVTGADSVYFTVGGVFKRLGGNATSCTFTAAELSTLSAGTSIVQIAAWTYTSEDIAGKTIYFGNETVQTRTITLQ